MKYELSELPESFKATWPGQFRTFSWVEFVAAIPQAISLITTWKEGRIPNACLQAWTMYNGDAGGYFVIFSVMNTTHTCRILSQGKDFAVNFPAPDIFSKCFATIKNNSAEIDEITASGLTVEQSRAVEAPRIKECFLNLECRMEWHKPLHEGSIWHLFAGRVVHVAIESENTQKGAFARYGSQGFTFNIHSPIDPGTGEQDNSMVGKIEPVCEM